MVRTKLSTRPWVVLIAQVLAKSYCVVGVLETNQDGPGAPDTNSKAAAATGGRVLPWKPADPRAAEEDVVAAARQCVALDGSRHFPADHSLGLFAMGDARASTPRITAASVEFVPQWHREKGGTGAGHTAVAAGTVGVSLLMEVDVTDERNEEEGGGGVSALGLHAACNVGESVPTRGEVETAAAEAAAVTNNAAEAQLAISALAAWNLVSHNGIAQEGTAARVEGRIEVAAAFGYRGDWYTSSKSLALVQDGGCIDGVVPLSASFGWQPTGDVWANLDGLAVAAVKVYGAPSAAMAGSTSTKQGELLLLQAALCKRASPGVVTGTAKRAATASLQATLEPYIEQSEYAILEANAASSSSRSPVVVAETEDKEWWQAREEEEYGRGMDAVNALPRIPGWKPGDWVKRRRRRKRQEEERERRRTGETAHRRAHRGGGEGDSGTGSRDGSKSCRRKSGWGTVKEAWRNVVQILRGAKGKLRRNE